jgi:iron(III) transport system permease protein
MRIVLPLVSATTVSTFFLTLTDTMFELPASSLLYPAGYPPFPVVVQGKFNAFQWGEGSALSVVGMVIVFGLYAVGRFIANRLERRIVRHAMQQSEIEELTSGTDAGSVGGTRVVLATAECCKGL